MLFEGFVEVFPAEYIGDRGPDAPGMLGVAAAEFVVDGLANIAETVGRHEPLENGVALSAVFSVVVVYGAVHAFYRSLSMIGASWPVGADSCFL